MGDTLDLAAAIVANVKSLPLDVVEFYLRHKDRIPGALEFGFSEAMKLYAPFLDLGTVTIPSDFPKTTKLRTTWFRDVLFQNGVGHQVPEYVPEPSFGIKPGARFTVKLFKQIASGDISNEEQLQFLRKEAPSLLGSVGIALLLQQKSGNLPIGHILVAPDEAGCLYCVDRYRYVSRLHIQQDGRVRHGLEGMERAWGHKHALVGFKPVKDGE